MRQHAPHLSQAPWLEPVMPIHIWSTPQDVEGESEIGVGELGLSLQPCQRQPHDPIVGNGEQEARPLRRRFP